MNIDFISFYLILVLKILFFSCVKYMNSSFEKLREKANASNAATNKSNLGSVGAGSALSSTAEALALSPAAKRLSSSSCMSAGGGRLSSGRSSQMINANQIFTAVQSNAQKFGKRLNSAFSSSPIKLIEAQNKNPISVYAGVVVTSSRSSRRRCFFFFF